jgi:glycosyltransferase involved in cell wall biosynthesis
MKTVPPRHGPHALRHSLARRIIRPLLKACVGPSNTTRGVVGMIFACCCCCCMFMFASTQTSRLQMALTVSKPVRTHGTPGHFELDDLLASTAWLEDLSTLMAPPKVSVVVYFTCARAQFFSETVQSLKAQTFKQHDAIFINDGCNRAPEREAFEEAVRAYSGSPSRVRVHSAQRAIGILACRNLGFAATSGAYVFLLEASDVLAPTALEKLYWYLKSNPGHAYVGSYVHVLGRVNYDHNHGLAQIALHDNSTIHTVSGMVRRSVYEQIGKFAVGNVVGEEDEEEDLRFWLECAKLNHMGGTVAEHLIWRREREGRQIRGRGIGRSSAVVKQLARSEGPDGPPLPAKEQLTMRPFAAIAADIADAIREPINLLDRRPGPELANGASQASQRRFMLILPWMEMGGADRFNLQLIRMLTADRWHVTIIATLGMHHPWRRQFEQVTSDVFVLPAFLRTYTDQANFCAYLLASRQPDVLMVSNSQFGYSVLPLLSSVAARLPRRVTIVDYNHMQEVDWRGGGYPRDGVDSQHLMDVNIVASDNLKQWMVDKGAKTERMRTCYIGVNTTEYFPDERVRLQTRARYKIPLDDVVVLFPARLVAQKQPLVFAQAIARVAMRTRMTVLVAGDGPYRQDFVSAIKSTPLLASQDLNAGPAAQSRLLMLGTVDFDSMYQIMQAADVVMVTSQMEGIALVAYEAMACGKVFIGAAVGGQPELITSECSCGFLVAHGALSPEEELDAYVEALSSVMSDPILRQNMGHASADRIRSTFALENMYKCTMHFGRSPRTRPRDATCQSLRRLQRPIAELQSCPRTECTTGKVWVVCCGRLRVDGCKPIGRKEGLRHRG